MAFANYEQYMSTFAGALENAGQPKTPSAFAPTAPMQQTTPGIAPGAGQPPQPGQPPAAMSPQPEQAFPQAPQTAPQDGAEKGLSMVDLLDEADEDERSQFADTVAKDMQIQDLEGKAQEVAQQDPELASKYKTGAPDKKWDRTEAAAFLLEFGLRMMQAGGSGEGNFLSDVGSSALGAREAMSQKKLAEEEKADRQRRREREDTEFDWKKEDRPGEVAETTAERSRRESAEKRAASAEKRAQEQHDSAKKRGEWTPMRNEETGTMVFYDPNTGEERDSGIQISARGADGKVSAFMEQLTEFQKAMAGGGEVWKTMSDAEKSEISKDFFEYQKTGVNANRLRENILKILVDANSKARKSQQRSPEEIQAEVDKLVPPEAPTGGRKLGWE